MYKECVNWKKEINKVLTYAAYNSLFKTKKIDIKSKWVKRYSFKMVVKEEQ